MERQILFIHSAGPQKEGQGSGGLVDFLKKELGKEFDLLHPAMPTPEDPKYKEWKSKLKEEFAKLAKGSILVGHSIGGSALLKFLSEEKINSHFSALILIASPVWGLNKDWVKKDFMLLPGFFHELPKISTIFLFHSANDSVVLFEHAEKYAELMPSAMVKKLNGNSHLFETGLLEVVEEIKKL